MQLTKWKIKDKIVEFPASWKKNDVLKFINSDYIKTCEYCGKVDISINHYSNCNPNAENQRKESLYYKD